MEHLDQWDEVLPSWVTALAQLTCRSSPISETEGVALWVSPQSLCPSPER